MNLPGLLLILCCLAGARAMAMDLRIEPARANCDQDTPPPPEPPAAAAQRIPESQAVAGSRGLAWVWLADPTRRYPHGALGSGVHAGSVQALAVAAPGAAPQTVRYTLPLHRVFEDRVPRLVDLDQDGRDEILLIEADALRGAALVLLGLRWTATGPELFEQARGPYAGTSFRWLNPVGVADFDGDGRLDVASVTTPHVGGVLTLHHVRPPDLVPFAKAMDVSNHRMGALEQRLAVIVHQPPARPAIVVPDMTRQALQALRWEAPGRWQEMPAVQPMPALVERLLPLPQGACALLADGSHWRVTLLP
ncbi:FG-GAP repeat domain-containing protein [Hydrogenophaga sp.]|uniref:FG-GAP repeat domain-containing protein n=1 Tax=Hydrogenophaga sp. TaxID=1904254 RepID=UPI003D100FCD